MTRFQKLAATTLGTAILLVTIGVIVRATDSGLGCPDWPLLPRAAAPAARRCRRRGSNGSIGPSRRSSASRSWAWRRSRGSTIAIAARCSGRRSGRGPRRVPGLARTRDRPPREQRGVGHGAPGGGDAAGGAPGVRHGPAGFPARVGGWGGSQRFTLLAAFATLATFALLLFGSHVTATDTALVFPDWPLMNGCLIPPLTSSPPPHVLHRWVAVVVGAIVVALAIVAWRTQRDPARDRQARRRGGGAVRDPGCDRRAAGPDPTVGLDPDAAPCAWCRDPRDARRAHRHELLRRPSRLARRPSASPKRVQRSRGRPATASAPTSR